MREVWILGAGFSYPLGAPLFGQVFSNSQQRISRQAIKRDDEPSEFREMLLLRKAALDLYRYGAEPLAAPRHWQNPEEYLQKLADAVRVGEKHLLHAELLKNASETASQISRERYTAWPNGLLSDVLKAAKLELAIETSHFLLHEDFTGEKWLPYIQWLRSLSGQDTVITFNYDEAIERLWYADDELADDDLQVGLPDIVPAEKCKPLHPDKPRLFKLHGSSGWYDGSMHRREWDGIPQVIRDPFTPPDILIPGPGKMSPLDFLGIWNMALQAISKANKIHIIGYSFPVTDSFAAYKILDALANRKTAGVLTIKTVLGPGYATDGVRIEATLAGLCEKIENIPMHAQHYLLRAAEAKQSGRRNHF